MKPKTETKLQWDGVYKYDWNDAYIFLYTSENTAIVIPKKKIEADLAGLNALLAEKIAPTVPST